MRDSDQKFVVKVILMLVALAFVVRLVLRFIGIQMEIPVMDPIIDTVAEVAKKTSQGLFNFVQNPVVNRSR